MKDKLKDLLGIEWYNLLSSEFDKPYMNNLILFLANQRQLFTVYPQPGEVFNAYKYTPYSNVRVCIVGQDPYINVDEAHGLAFSTLNNQYTPSLKQIEKAVRKEIYADNKDYLWYNNLTDWTQQGIMLLNTVLTVKAGVSNSHKGQGWENFTLKTVQELDKKGIIFLLWGKDAQELGKHITNSTVLTCEHPVYAHRQERDWINNNCFQKVNNILTTPIQW